MDPIFLLLAAGGLLYAIVQGQKQAATLAAPSSFAIGQVAYLVGPTSMQVGGQAVTLQVGTRVYVQTSDASGMTMIRTDSGNSGTVPTSALSATLPSGVTMQVN